MQEPSEAVGREAGVIPDMDDMEHVLLRVKADTKPEESLDSESVPCVTRAPCPFPAFRTVLAVCLPRVPVQLPMTVTLMCREKKQTSRWQLCSIRNVFRFFK